MNDSFFKIAQLLVEILAEADDDVEEFKIWQHNTSPDGQTQEWAIEVPVMQSNGTYHRALNYVKVPTAADENEVIETVEGRLRGLITSRDYPVGSFLSAPWGLYLVQGKGSITKL